MLTDLAVDQTVRDQLKNLDLPRCRILPDFTRAGRRERDDRAMPPRATARGGCLESTAVIAVTVEDLLALGSVHASAIGAPTHRL